MQASWNGFALISLLKQLQDFQPSIPNGNQNRSMWMPLPSGQRIADERRPIIEAKERMPAGVRQSESPTRASVPNAEQSRQRMLASRVRDIGQSAD